MSNYRARPSPPDRAKAIAAVALVHAGMAALLLIRTDSLELTPEEPTPVLIDIAPPPPPPPPPPEPSAGRTREEEGAAGKEAEPTPVVAPPPRIPAPTPLPAAPVAGTGSATTAGAAERGTGPGAGGSGTGRGGGGTGGGIGTEARLVGGNRSRLPSRLLRQFAADRGDAHLWLTIAATGRATDCSVLRGTGNSEVDQSLCELMIRQSRWTAARDRQGRPITVKTVYVATWSKD